MTKIELTSNLPQDPHELQKMYVQSVQLFNQMVDEFNKMKNELDWYRRNMHGTKSERIYDDDSKQVEMTELLDQVPESDDFEVIEETKEVKTRTRKPKKKGHGRNELPDHLRRETEVIPLDEDLVKSIGKENLVKIDEEITEYLEKKSGELYVKRIIREKWVDKREDAQKKVLIPKLPPRPIDKGLAGVSLLAYIIVCKFVDHLPLYRLRKRFEREKVTISETTMTGWLKQIYELLIPVYLSMIDTLKAGDIINTDDTKLPVLVKGLKHKTHKGFMWVYIGNDIVIYDYRKSKGKDGPLDFLKDYKDGYLQADAYPGYDQCIKDYELLEVGCWAHARRKFYESLDTEPGLAREMLNMVKELYVIEKHCKKQKFDETRIEQYRQEKSLPILADIKEWLDNKHALVLPASPIGKAVSYALNHWEALERYICDGRLDIDNNISERFMKYVVMGRKNYLFAGSHEAAKRNALFYSLTGTCNLLGINPEEYLGYVLDKIATWPIKRIAELTPQAWKKMVAGSA